MQCNEFNKIFKSSQKPCLTQDNKKVMRLKIFEIGSSTDFWMRWRYGISRNYHLLSFQMRIMGRIIHTQAGQRHPPWPETAWRGRNSWPAVSSRAPWSLHRRRLASRPDTPAIFCPLRPLCPSVPSISEFSRAVCLTGMWLLSLPLRTRAHLDHNDKATLCDRLRRMGVTGMLRILRFLTSLEKTVLRFCAGDKNNAGHKHDPRQHRSKDASALEYMRVKRGRRKRVA